MNQQEQSAVFVLLIILGIYVIGAIIVFFVEYIFDMEGDFTGPAIFAWPAVIPILIVAGFCHWVKQFWIIAGGPKLKGIAVRNRDEYKKRRADAYDNLRTAVRHARNSGVSSEEVASLIKDDFVKEIMES